eukprot:3748155-Prorocentrum_lima.AAC.1
MVSHGHEDVGDDGRMTPGMRDRLTRETWERPLRTMALRCDTLTQKRTALSQRSVVWNTYIAA